MADSGENGPDEGRSDDCSLEYAITHGRMLPGLIQTMYLSQKRKFNNTENTEKSGT